MDRWKQYAIALLPFFQPNRLCLPVANFENPDNWQGPTVTSLFDGAPTVVYYGAALTADRYVSVNSKVAATQYQVCSVAWLRRVSLHLNAVASDSYEPYLTVYLRVDERVGPS
jgi:hypothetical protein